MSYPCDHTQGIYPVTCASCGTVFCNCCGENEGMFEEIADPSYAYFFCPNCGVNHIKSTHYEDDYGGSEEWDNCIPDKATHERLKKEWAQKMNWRKDV